MPDAIDPRRFVVYQAGGENVAEDALALSSGGLRALFAFIRRVYEGEVNYEDLQIWHDYEGVPLFRAQVADELIIFAVEQVSSKNDTRISIMFVGSRITPYSGPSGTWDGTDDAALWNVVRRRCQQHFI